MQDAEETVLERTVYAYDTASYKLMSITRYDLDNGKHQVTEYVYDSAAGTLDKPYLIRNKVKTSPEQWNEQYFHYNVNGLQDESWYLADLDQDGTNDRKVITRSIFDDAGRVRRTEREIRQLPGETVLSNTVLSQTFYNSASQVDYSINATGQITRQWYDRRGYTVQAATYLHQEDLKNDLPLTVSETLYDAAGRVVVRTEPHEPGEPALANVLEYDNMGRAHKTHRYKNVEITVDDVVVNGMVIGRESTSWNESEAIRLTTRRSEYDVAGRVKKSYVEDEAGTEQAVIFDCDKSGRRVKVTDPLGRVTVTHYNGPRRDWVVDARGYLQGADPDDFKTRFTYNTGGQLIKTQFPNTLFDDNVTPLPTYRHVGYDSLGQQAYQTEQIVEEILDENNFSNVNKREFFYDAGGRLVEVNLPKVDDPEDGTSDLVTIVFTFDYDVFGNLIKITDAKGRETTFTYNELHRETSRKLPDGRTEYKEYDNLSRLTKHTDFEGQVTGLWYDTRGRLQFARYYESNTDYPSSPAKIHEYRYDVLGRRVKVYENSVLVQHTTYNNIGQVAIIASPQGSIGYGYYKTGRRWFVRTPAVGDLTDPNDLAGVDTQLRFTYTPLGQFSRGDFDRLEGTIPTLAAPLDPNEPFDPNIFIGYEYNAVGALERIVYPNKNTAEYVYDALNRLSRLTHKDKYGVELARFAYDFYADGMRQRATETINGGTTVLNWQYDNIDRLLQEVYDAPGTGNDYTADYVYDLAGNRKSKTVGGVTTDYVYNNLDHLTSETTSGVTTTYGYDQNGSLTSKSVGGNVTSYIYNLQQRMVEIKENGNSIAEYRYNPDGFRVQKSWDEGAKLTDYLADPLNFTGLTQVLKETTSGQVSPTDPNDFSERITYINGLDVVGQTYTEVDDPNVLIYLYDGHGSLRALTWLNGDPANGQLLNDQFYHYDAYGNTLSHSTQNPLVHMQYAGEYYDAHWNGGYNRHRWTLPPLGRFNRHDPLMGTAGNPITLHRYLYAANNPVNMIDPTGEQFTAQEILVVTGAIGLLGGLTLPALNDARDQRLATLDRVNPYERPDGIAYLGPGLHEQFERDMLEIADPDLRGMTFGFWDDLGHGNQLVLYQKTLAEVRVLDTVETVVQGADIANLTFGLGTAAIWRSPKLVISLDKAHGGPTHWNKILELVVRQFDDVAQIDTIYVNRGLSTITDKAVTRRLLPDVAVKLKNGKYRIYEVFDSETAVHANDKIHKYREALGDLMDVYRTFDAKAPLPANIK